MKRPKPHTDRKAGKSKNSRKVGDPQVVRGGVQIGAVLDPLLDEIKRTFYRPEHSPKCLFHRDRQQLLHALSWPAHWLDQRHLIVTAGHYRRIVQKQMANIVEHGDAEIYLAYFPRYLLKCLQDHFRHRGDRLYDEIKLVSYAIPAVLDLIKQQPIRPEPSQTEIVEQLAQLHDILRSKNRQKRQKSQDRQMWLF